MAKPERPDAPAGVPDPAQTWEQDKKEREKYAQRLTEVLAALTWAENYITTIRLSLYAIAVSGQENTVTSVTALHRVTGDIERWLAIEAQRLSQPIEKGGEDTVH